MAQQRRRRRRAHNLNLIIAALSVVLVGLLVLALVLGNLPPAENPGSSSTSSSSSSDSSSSSSSSGSSSSSSSSSSSEKRVEKESSFTLSAMGDMLMHMPVVNSCANGNGYNFDSLYRYIAPLIQSADYAAGNLETTLAGLDNGYGYSGYPQFNCPDEIIDGMKDAGFDMVLTANNHSYDTGSAGFNRTMQTIAGKDMAVLGTKPTAESPNFMIIERNGIRLALACYSYEDDGTVAGKAPNGWQMSPEDALLYNGFDYSNLDLFYEEIESSMESAAAEGVDAFVMFIHWGDEYRLTHNSNQSQIAQALCDLGVDVIIGGHPHVVQPMELLTSTTDESHKTVCLYSMGNAVSNQRRQNMSLNTGHTEDGILFNVTFTRYSDGTVILESAECVPTWVYLGTNPETGRWEYNILPVNDQRPAWLTDSVNASCDASYDRTMAIIGDGQQQVTDYLTRHQAEIEAELGVQ